LTRFEIKTNINPKKVYIVLEYDEKDGKFICGYMHCPNRSKWNKEDYPWIEYEISSTYWLDKENQYETHSSLHDMEGSLMQYRDLRNIWEIYEFDSQKKATEFLEIKKTLRELTE